jgi:hypothetical protein
MIDVRGGQRDLGLAVEAATLLIAVQSRTHPREINPARAANEQQIIPEVGLHGDTGSRQIESPSRFY